MIGSVFVILLVVGSVLHLFFLLVLGFHFFLLFVLFKRDASVKIINNGKPRALFELVGTCFKFRRGSVVTDHLDLGLAENLVGFGCHCAPVVQACFFVELCRLVEGA